METRYATDPNRYETMTTEELRAAFLVDRLFRPGELNLSYFETERAIVGSAMPTREELVLEASRELAADFFCQRRELGVLNIGNQGHVTVDDQVYDMGRLDCLYVGRGSRRISFNSKVSEQPARFYLLSFPAHTEYPTALARREDADPTRLGTAAEANERTIYKCIYPGGIESCQLVLGYTTLEPGSVWNTMPAHTHARRSEVYMYFDLDQGAVVHVLGRPDKTRHLIVREGNAVLSPMWSIHTGAGTRAYTFCWGMGGENQEFSDMDDVQVDTLR